MPRVPREGSCTPGADASAAPARRPRPKVRAVIAPASGREHARRRVPGVRYSSEVGVDPAARDLPVGAPRADRGGAEVGSTPRGVRPARRVSARVLNPGTSAARVPAAEKARGARRASLPRRGRRRRVRPSPPRRVHRPAVRRARDTPTDGTRPEAVRVTVRSIGSIDSSPEVRVVGASSPTIESSGRSRRIARDQASAARSNSVTGSVAVDSCVERGARAEPSPPRRERPGAPAVHPRTAAVGASAVTVIGACRRGPVFAPRIADREHHEQATTPCHRRMSARGGGDCPLGARSRHRTARRPAVADHGAGTRSGRRREERSVRRPREARERPTGFGIERDVHPSGA